MDFAGPYQNNFFNCSRCTLKVARSDSDTIHISRTNSSCIKTIICYLCTPLQLVSDNSPQFMEVKFQHFLKGNRVKHIRCTPYHPSSNGLEEQFVRTFKQAMKAGEGDGLPLLHRLQNFLLSYRATPHATINISPSSLFLHCPI